MATMASSVAMLPVFTLDLARRYWAPLLCVYTAGTFLHGMMLRGLVMVADYSTLLGIVGLSVSVLVTLTTTIIMFHLMTPGLPVLDAELVRPGRPDESVGFGERERRVVDAVAMAILPFLIFYSAWGMFADEFRDFSAGVINATGLEGVQAFTFDDLAWPLVIAFGSWGARAVCERYYARNDNKWLGILTALFEANWMFFAVFSVGTLTGDAVNWMASRAVFSELHLATLDGMTWLGGISSVPFAAGYLGFLALVVDNWTHLKEALFEPLLWLTIASVVFGAEMDKSESLFRRGSRADREARRVTRLTPKLVKGIGQVAGRGTREKYTPFLNALRFILRVSPLFVLSFCLFYVLLELGFGWLERGIYIAIGPGKFIAWWWPWLEPIGFAVDALHEVLRVCLLAATFEMTLRRLSTASVGRRARRSQRPTADA